MPTLHGSVLRQCLAILAGLTLASAADPTFNPDGAISVGSQRLALNPMGEITITGPGGSTSFHLPLNRRSDGQWSTAGKLEGARIAIDQAARSVVLSGGYRYDAAEAAIPVAWGYQLREDGTIRITASSSGPRSLLEVAIPRISLHVKRSLLVGQAVEVDGQATAIAALAAPEDRPVTIHDAPAQRILAQLALPARLTLAPSGMVRTVVIDRHSTTRDGGGVVEFNAYCAGAEAWVDLRIEDLAKPSGSETYAGVDYGIGGLHLPHRLPGNLVENPGFEQGFRCWDSLQQGDARARTVAENYRIVESGAYEGRRCLEMLADPAARPGPIATFGMPVLPGKPYVLSFYARSEPAGGRLEIASSSAFFPHADCSGRIEASGDWQRHRIVFTPSNPLACIGFVPATANQAGCRIWLDAIQVEPGSEPGPFASKPVAAVLVSNGRGNVLPPEAVVGAALRLDGRPRTTGSVAVTAATFDGAIVHQESMPFDLGEAGTARLELPWADRLGRGMWTIATAIATADGFADRDWHRLTVMPFAPDAGTHRLLFSGGGYDGRRGGHDLWAEFYRRAGIGAAVVHDPAEEGYRAAFAARGVYFYSSIFAGGDHVVIDGATTDVRGGYPDLGPTQLAGIEAYCFARAKANPAIREWKTVNEPEITRLLSGPDRAARMRAFIALQAAAWRGIKRADPAMQVMSPDCSSMYPSTGIAFIDAWFEAGGGEFTDIVAVHPYRTRPEDPDLDAHTAALLRLLDRRRFAGEVWFTEGIYHQPYHIPAFNLTPHQGCSSDGCRATAFGYDLARAERMAAAYTMRSWLVGLKYGDRVKNQVDWGFPGSRRALDQDLTPSAAVFASNTLADLLGRATFTGDVEYGAGIRGYAFCDDRQRPVVALWSCDEARDLGMAGAGPDPVLVLPALPPGTECIAFDGHAAPAPARLAITPWPRFLRGPAGSQAALRAALEAGSFPDGGVPQLHAGMRLLSPAQAQAQVANLLGRPVRGQLTVSADGKILHDATVEIAGKAASQVPVPIAMRNGELTPVAARIAFTPAGATAATAQDCAFECGSISRLAQPPAIDGDLADWPAASVIAMPQRRIDFNPLTADERKACPSPIAWKGPEDLSATVRLGWDDANLYLGIEVRDDVHDPIDDVARAWMGDGLQFYLDSWGDARERNLRGYGNDDQTFRVWAGRDGSLRCIRDVAPERQIAFLDTGPVAGARTAFRRQGDRSVYELALPLRELQPLKLAAGTVCGLAILVNDRDGDYRKRALTMTPAGTEPHMHPELFPLWVLAP